MIDWKIFLKISKCQSHAEYIDISIPLTLIFSIFKYKFNFTEEKEKKTFFLNGDYNENIKLTWKCLRIFLNPLWIFHHEVFRRASKIQILVGKFDSIFSTKNTWCIRLDFHLDILNTAPVSLHFDSHWHWCRTLAEQIVDNWLPHTQWEQSTIQHNDKIDPRQNPHKENSQMMHRICNFSPTDRYKCMGSCIWNHSLIRIKNSTRQIKLLTFYFRIIHKCQSWNAFLIQRPIRCFSILRGTIRWSKRFLSFLILSNSKGSYRENRCPLLSIWDCKSVLLDPNFPCQLFSCSSIKCRNLSGMSLKRWKYSMTSFLVENYWTNKRMSTHLTLKNFHINSISFALTC